MIRHDWANGQAYGPEEYEDFQDGLEQSERNHQTEQHGSGILTGLDVGATSPESMNVEVDVGTGHESEGRRIRVDSLQTVDCSVDRNGDPTTPSAGKERWLTLVAVFKRLWTGTAVYDPIRHTNIQPIGEESFEIEVVAGAEATPGNAVQYTPAADELLLCDILIDSSTTQITDAMIDGDRRTTQGTMDNPPEIGPFLPNSTILGGRGYYQSATGLYVPHVGVVVVDGSGNKYFRKSTGLITKTVSGAIPKDSNYVCYVYVDAESGAIDADALTVSAEAPTADHAKGGWYNASGQRFLFAWPVNAAGDAFVSGFRGADGRAWMDETGAATVTTVAEADVVVPGIPLMEGAMALPRRVSGAQAWYITLSGLTAASDDQMAYTQPTSTHYPGNVLGVATAYPPMLYTYGDGKLRMHTSGNNVTVWHFLEPRIAI